MDLVIIGGIALCGFLFNRWKSKPPGDKIWELFFLKIPIVGSLYQKVLQARFTRNLGVLLENKVPILISLQVMSRLIDHAILEKRLNRACKKLKKGVMSLMLLKTLKF